jgi:two-component system, chemotaxis family, chemotaxis protein CheY
MKDFHTVLIVDDSPTSRMIIQRCIEMSGIESVEFLHAENGIDALAVLSESESVDLIFTDINMPKMDGQTFVRLLKNKERTSRIPVIITSSIADGSVEKNLTALGIAGFIKKPVSPEKILNVFGGLS